MLNWTEIIAAIIGSNVLVAIIDILKTFFEEKRKNKSVKDSFALIFDTMHDVYEELTFLLNTTGASRVCIVKAEDSGNVPHVDVPLFTTILYEVVKSPLTALKDRWNKIQIDRQHINILKDVSNIGYYKIDAITLEDSLLKDVFITSGIHTAYLYKIAYYPDKFIYLVLHFTDPVEFNHEYRELINLSVPKLQRLFKKANLNE